MPGSTEAQVARIEEQVKGVKEILAMLVGKMDEASASRKLVHQAQEAMRLDIVHINHRLDTMDTEIKAIRPTSEEFARTQQQVMGAGKLGVWLWRIGGVVLAIGGWVYGLYLGIVGHPPP